MGKELRVRSDEAYDVAHRLAEARGESVDAVVETALRAMDMRGAAAARRDGVEGAGAEPGDVAEPRRGEDDERTADAIIEEFRKDIEARRRAMTVEGEDIFSEAAIARRRERRRALVAWINRDACDRPGQAEDDMYDENGLPI